MAKFSIKVVAYSQHVQECDLAGITHGPQLNDKSNYLRT